MELEEKLRTIIGTIMNVPVDTIDDQSGPETIVNWDSLRHMRLILAVEDSYSVTFSDSEITNINDVKSLKETLKPYIGKIYNE